MSPRLTVSSFLKAGKLPASATVCDTLFHNQIIQGKNGGVYINLSAREKNDTTIQLYDPKWLSKLYGRSQDWHICMQNQQLRMSWLNMYYWCIVYNELCYFVSKHFIANQNIAKFLWSSVMWTWLPSRAQFFGFECTISIFFSRNPARQMPG